MSIRYDYVTIPITPYYQCAGCPAEAPAPVVDGGYGPLPGWTFVYQGHGTAPCAACVQRWCPACSLLIVWPEAVR